MYLRKLFGYLVVLGMLCIPAFAEDDITPFSWDWIVLHQSGSAFPEVNSQTYSVKNGVLFRGNELVAYPSEKRDKVYYVPEGTDIIASCAFDGNLYLEVIVLPSSVTCIGDGAFVGCANLREINFPERLLVIGIGAFAQCHSLENIILPPNLYVIGTQAFCEASTLMGTLTIPPTVRYIGDEAFCHTHYTEVIFEGCPDYVGYDFIGEPDPSLHYRIQIPDISYTFAEKLQQEYKTFDNMTFADMAQ